MQKEKNKDNIYHTRIIKLFLEQNFEYSSVLFLVIMYM